MKCLDKFNKKMSVTGNSIRNENIFNARMMLHQTFQDDPSFSFGIYRWKMGCYRKIDYETDDTINIRLYKRSFSSANGWTVKFQTEYDTPIVCGDLLYDSMHDMFLLCTESFDVDYIHYQGKLTRCNWILKWQNSDGDILEYPCYDINATQYNSGETNKTYYTIGTSQHILTLPADENTIILDTPKRFLLDKNTNSPSTYIITQNDTTADNYDGKGLCNITVAQYELNRKRDNIELGICDYIDPNSLKNEIDSDTKPVSSIIKYDTKIIKSGGNKQEFIGIFVDENGNELADFVPKWTIIAPFDVDALTRNYSDDSYKISISIDNEDYIDEEFKLVFSDENSNYSSTLLIKIESLL